MAVRAALLLAAWAAPGAAAAQLRAAWVAPSDLGDLAPRDLAPHAAVARGPRPVAAEALEGIRSVSCLRAKQLDPRFPCNGTDEVPDEVLDGLVAPETPASLSFGNFPNFRDPVCHGEGQLLCDPDGLLGETQRAVLAKDLKLFREKTVVSCGALEKRLGTADGDDGIRRHFNLAVILLRDWPASESDPDSLQRLGQLVLQQWGLIPIYNGVDAANPVDEPLTSDDYAANCPNAAALIVLPAIGEAAVSAPSCEFICAERGGIEVADAIQAGFQHGDGLADTIRRAVRAVGSALAVGVASPLSLAMPETERFRRADRRKRKAAEKYFRSDAYVVGLQRLVLFGAVAFIVFAIVAFLVYNCTPKIPSLRKVG